MKRLYRLLMLAAQLASGSMLAQDAAKPTKVRTPKEKADKDKAPNDSLKQKGLFASESVLEFTLTSVTPGLWHTGRKG